MYQSIPLSYVFLYALPTQFVQTFAQVFRSDGSTCSCGFYEPNGNKIFTDSIIVYFNETESIPIELLEIEAYENSRENCWNCVYRQAASVENVQLVGTVNSSLLHINVSPSTAEHLVIGGGIRTIRQDIQYGSFQALMRPPIQEVDGGSALSMVVAYNDTESIEMSLMNTDSRISAWVGTFMKDEFPSHSLGINYSALSHNSSQPGIDYSQDLAVYKIDWTETWLNFTIGTKTIRTVYEGGDNLPQTPGRVFLKHWSTGNKYSMGGPPRSTTSSSVKWIRFFFNSSITSEQLRKEFDTSCAVDTACSTDDWTLRGSTTYSDDSKRPWSPGKMNKTKRVPAIVIAIFCISTSGLLISHALAKQTLSQSHKRDQSTENNENVLRSNFRQEPNPETLSKSSSTHGTTKGPKIGQKEADATLSLVVGSQDHLTGKDTGPNDYGLFNGNKTKPCQRNFGSPCGGTPETSQASSSTLLNPSLVIGSLEEASTRSKKGPEVNVTPGTPNTKDGEEETALAVGVNTSNSNREVLTCPPLKSQAKRIDHLAGLVALCAIFVTLMHFGLTFVPAIVVPGAPYHSVTEIWVRKVISPFVLNQMWLGVFFTTSSRFLITKYLKDGDLSHIAQTAVRRVPRLMIPVVCMVLLEYFLIDIGTTKYLEFVPSLSWSTWPYVVRFLNFGHFVSSVIELAFLIPNAVPHISYNYCTGVLWTIAVQLQGSWVVLLGVVVVREIHNPWKRFSYYAVCVSGHWYAQSWGSYLWLGILLTDLDVTYKWKKWLHARPAAYYSLLLFAFILVALGFTANVLPNWASYNFPIHEAGIHPDPETGLPIERTPRAGYPEYYVPRLNGLAFATGMQIVVEVSPLAQRILSWRGLVAVFPHIFTIYLVHGMVFWSWGAWLACFLADRYVPWSINVVAVGLTSYAWLALSLPVLTPVVERLGRGITNVIWRNASEAPPKKRPTLYPFHGDLLKDKSWQKCGESTEQCKGKEVRISD